MSSHGSVICIVGPTASGKSSLSELVAKKTSNLFRSRSEEQEGLDVSGLSGVIEVDPVACTADVQGMCTYEDLVDATLPHGLMPFVVPQLLPQS